MSLALMARSVARVLGGVALCAAVPATAIAQGTVTGRITFAATGEPLANAHIIGVGTVSSATSGQDGRYTLKHVGIGPVTIQVLRVGFRSEKQSIVVPAAGTASADFQLSVTIVKLADVITTGTGEQRAVEVGYSTSSLDDVPTRMERSPTTLTIGDLLIQKVASVNVLEGGMVGTAASIRIRGLNSLNQTNEPIVMVDGIRVVSSVLTPGSGVGGSQTSLLNSFTPEEIETIDILKGPAATSLYGTNAANGAIVITTKRGRVGNARWTWTAEQGTINDRNDYPSSYAIWGHAPTGGAAVRCLLPTMDSSTCLQDSVTSFNLLDNASLTPIATGRRSLYGMQMAGGSDVVRYFVSGNVENARGPVRMPGFALDRLDSLLVPVRGEWKNPEALQRENFRANMNATLTPSLDIGVSSAFIKSDQRFPQSDGSPIGIYAAARENPGFNHAGLGYSNVGSLGENLHGYNLWIPSEIFQDLNTQDVQRELLSGTASWRPRSWMANEASTGVDFSTISDFSVCRLNECPAYTNFRNGQSYSKTTNARTISAKLSSASTWNARPDLNVKGTVGTEYINIESDNSAGTGVGLPPGAQNVSQAAARTNATNLTGTVGKTLGVFVQGQAALRDRVFLNLGLRGDQNSAFGANQQWAAYPNASLSWLVSDEAFFTKPAWLDQLRIRSAYGTSGMQPGLTSAFKTYAPITVNLGPTADALGLIGSQSANLEIKPERTREIEAGFDARILRNRVSLEMNYFNKRTSDAIVAAPIAPSSAAPSLLMFTNLGAVANTGVEAVVVMQLADRKSFAWDATISASHGSSEVLGTGPTGPIISGNTRQTNGFPMNALFYRTYTYSDANNDGRIQPGEVVVDTTMRYAGYQVPRDLVGIQNGIELFARRLRLTALLDYKGGHSVFNASEAFLCQQYASCADESNPNASLANQARSVANRYGTVVNGTAYTTGAGYLSNGRFWRLREVSATLTLPDNATKLLRAERASLNFGARNLHVWSKYSGVDPEVNYGAGDLQTDFMTAAPPTYFTLRLNLHY